MSGVGGGERRGTIWFEALRPRTWPASMVPVLVGCAVAGRAGSFDALVASVTLAVALLLQIASNLINDWGDHVRGADDENRIGPARASQSGEVAPRQVAIAGGMALLAAAAGGTFLVWHGGWPILVVGVAAMIAAAAYTAGPFPLAYHGLGEVFVLAFFGLGAVLGTQYLQAGSISLGGFACAVGIGALASAILLVNNIRDVDGDRRANKRTIVVRLGRDAGKAIFLFALVMGFGAILAGVLLGWLNGAVLLVFLSLPLAIRPARAVLSSTDGPVLNTALAETAKLELIFGLLLCLGLLI